MSSLNRNDCGIQEVRSSAAVQEVCSTAVRVLCPCQKTVFGKGYENGGLGSACTYKLFRTAEAHGIQQGLRALDLHNLKRHRERSGLMQAFKIVERLAGVRGHRESLFDISGRKH